MADSLSIEIRGLNEVVADLGRASRDAGPRVAAVVRKTAADIEATSKQFAPVDTGALRNSIGHDFEQDWRSASARAVIGPTVEYARFVEWGTSTQGPQAFMGPALDRHSADFVTALGDVVGTLDGKG